MIAWLIESGAKKALKKIRVLAEVIHEESKYPGRPQPHVVAKNPLWGGGDNRDDSDEESTKQESENKDLKESKTKTKTKTSQADGVAPDRNVSQETSGVAEKPKETENSDKGSLDEEGADYWFLQYDDVEGWNESNPGKKKENKK